MRNTAIQREFAVRQLKKTKSNLMKKTLLTSLLLAATATFSSAAGDNWMTDFSAAKEKAAKQDKDLLVDFTGSDWCVWCKKLDAEVFQKDAFKKGVDDKYILVELDFPKDTSGMSDELQKQNAMLQKKFQIKGFPTILLLDDEGRPYARTGYQKGGAEKYLAHLSDLRDMRDKRDAAFAKAEKLEGVAKAKALVKALDNVPEEFKGQYQDTMEEIKSLDPKDETGFIAKQERKQALQKLQKESMMAAQNGENAEAVIDKIDKFIAENSLEGAEKQEVMAIKLNPLMGSKKFDKALTLLDDIIAVDPDSPLSGRVRQFKPQSKQASEKDNTGGGDSPAQ